MMHLKKVKFFLLGIFLLGFSSFALALEIPTPQAYVNDYANLLEASKRQSLELQLKHFEEETSNQIMLALFPSLEKESLEDFSQRLAEKWKVGQKLKKNGVVLIVFVKEKALRIEVGYGLEAVLTDALSERIIQNEIIPRFKNQDYSGGVFAGVQAIEVATRGEYKGSGRRRNASGLGTIIFLIILFSIFSRRGRGITFFPGGFGGGGSWGGGGSDGGFSGGGGGSFGGGGASGRW